MQHFGPGEGSEVRGKEMGFSILSLYIFRVGRFGCVDTGLIVLESRIPFWCHGGGMNSNI